MIKYDTTLFNGEITDILTFGILEVNDVAREYFNFDSEVKQVHLYASMQDPNDVLLPREEFCILDYCLSVYFIDGDSEDFHLSYMSMLQSELTFIVEFEHEKEMREYLTTYYEDFL